MNRIVIARSNIEVYKKRKDTEETRELIKNMENFIKDLLNSGKELAVCKCGSDVVVESFRCKALWSIHKNKFKCDDDRSDTSQYGYTCGKCGKRIKKQILDELWRMTK